MLPHPPFSVAFFWYLCHQGSSPTFALTFSDRPQSSIPSNLRPSSLFTSPAIHEYVAKVDAYNTALFEKQQQKPTSREESRGKYVKDWDSACNAQDNKKAECAGPTGTLHKLLHTDHYSHCHRHYEAVTRAVASTALRQRYRRFVRRCDSPHSPGAANINRDRFWRSTGEGHGTLALDGTSLRLKLRFKAGFEL